MGWWHFRESVDLGVDHAPITLDHADPGPRAVCLTAMCDRIDDICFDRLRRAGKAHFRIFARHDPAAATSAVGKPEGEEKLKLLRYDPRRPSESRKKARADNRYAPPVLDLAVGSRVAVSENIAVNLGLYRGALGTIVGFVFEEDAPMYDGEMPDVEDVAEEGVDDQEIPIVLVRMEDHYTGPSCIVGEPNVVPFYATPSRDRVLGKYHRVQLPLEPAHARTIHKAQGLTASHGVIVVPGANAPTHLGLYCVAISRAKWANALFATAPFAPKHFQNNRRQYERIDRFYERIRRRFRNQEAARVRDSADFERRQREYEEDRRQRYECHRLASEAAEVAREADAFLAAQAAAAAALAAQAKQSPMEGGEVVSGDAAPVPPALRFFGETRNLVAVPGDDDDDVSSKDSLMSDAVHEQKRRCAKSSFRKSDAIELSKLVTVEARLNVLEAFSTRALKELTRANSLSPPSGWRRIARSTLLNMLVEAASQGELECPRRRELSWVEISARYATARNVDERAKVLLKLKQDCLTILASANGILIGRTRTKKVIVAALVQKGSLDFVGVSRNQTLV